MSTSCIHLLSLATPVYFYGQENLIELNYMHPVEVLISVNISAGKLDKNIVWKANFV